MRTERTAPSVLLDCFTEQAAFRAIEEQLDGVDASARISAEGLPAPVRAILTGLISRSWPLIYVAADEANSRRITGDLFSLGWDREFVHIPSWSPGTSIPRSPSVEVLSARIEALYSLATSDPSMIIASRQALATLSAAPQDIRQRSFTLQVGDEIDLLSLVETLVKNGFERVGTVQEVGEIALRGGILDVFSFGQKRPFRCELWGDEIESIRDFEVHSQRSVGSRSAALILPRRELVLDPDRCTELQEELNRAGRRKVAERLAVDPYFEGHEAHIAPYLKDARALAQHLSDGRVLLVEEEISPAEGPLVLIPNERLLDSLPHSRRIDFVELALTNSSSDEDPRIRVQDWPRPSGSGNALCGCVASMKQKGLRSIIFCESEAHRRRSRQLLEEEELDAELVIGGLSGGFLLPDAGLAVFTDHELFKRRAPVSQTPRFEQGAHIIDAFTLQPGDYVVHIDHGMGRFEGLRRLTVDGRRTDCLRLAYEGGDELWVPIDQLDRVQRFRDSDERSIPARLDKIGGKAWERRLTRTRGAIADMAKGLLELYARRKKSPGQAYPQDGPWELELAESFPWEETRDQHRALNETRRDLIAARPMDRLICGDVGFGKTEVALRAAFKVVLAGKQVAMLVPTTLLAEQHLETFRARFAPYPVEVRALSRFRASKTQKEILRGLTEGLVDVVIGTHRLLSGDVGFADLGLLIVDEEHRFGVKQKEKIKSLRVRVDCLSMTATPIPRTLHMALSGIRDLSLISTPPKNRFPVQTEIVAFSEAVIVEAIERELAREGQVFFVHNRIQSLGAMENLLRGIVPHARIGVAHGRMPERQLERTMAAFYRGETEVLLSTMIVESGLDLPNANTLIVNRADRLGLAQLHQLRGRVGRGARRARAFFLVPSTGRLSTVARRRLRAVRDHTELGAGHALALRDMEIRGTGNLLGPQQHGFIQTVGFETYCRLLDQVVGELTGQPIAEDVSVRIHIELDVYVPEGYIPDSAERFTLYKRICRLTQAARADDLLAECRDRYGRPPAPLENLVRLKEIELRLRTMGIEELALKEDTATFRWALEHTPKRHIIEGLAEVLADRVIFRPGEHFAATVAVNPKLESIGQLVAEMQAASQAKRGVASE